MQNPVKGCDREAPASFEWGKVSKGDTRLPEGYLGPVSKSWDLLGQYFRSFYCVSWLLSCKLDVVRQ